MYKVLYKLSGFYNYFLYRKYVLGLGISFRAPKNVKLGKSCRFETGVVLNAFDGELSLGDRVSINFNSVLSAGHGIIRIDDDVLIGPNVVIRSSNHRLEKDRRNQHQRGVINIEKNVWIGAGVVILPDVTIGHDSIIGAGSIVTKNVESNSLYVGNPAKKIKDITV